MRIDKPKLITRYVFDSKGTLMELVSRSVRVRNIDYTNSVISNIERSIRRVV